MAAVMGAVVTLMGRLPFRLIWVMLLQIVTGVVIYVLLSIITGNRSFRFLLQTIKSYLPGRKA